MCIQSEERHFSLINYTGPHTLIDIVGNHLRETLKFKTRKIYQICVKLVCHLFMSLGNNFRNFYDFFFSRNLDYYSCKSMKKKILSEGHHKVSVIKMISERVFER